MNQKTLQKNLRALLAASLLTASAAQAAVISHSNSHGPELTDWDPAKTLALQQFNPALGSLNAVSLQFSGDMQAEFFASSPFGGWQTITNTLAGSMRFVLPTLALQTLAFGNQDSFDLEGGDESLRMLDASASAGLTLLSGWAAFVGLGSFDVGVFALGDSSMGGGGNVDGGAVTSATATVTVSYDYTANRNAVPEPSALALVGLALAAAGLAARARRSACARQRPPSPRSADNLSRQAHRT